MGRLKRLAGGKASGKGGGGAKHRHPPSGAGCPWPSPERRFGHRLHPPFAHMSMLLFSGLTLLVARILLFESQPLHNQQSNRRPI